jgi:AcrR family transcriptional regulator
MPTTTDRRRERHEATRLRILEAAWQLARARGLTGWTLRELARAVDMKAPSLYVYFDSKEAIYDAMFAQGYEQLAERTAEITWPADPTEALRLGARTWVEFAVADPARLQLLFLRVIPDFVPSKESYAVATDSLDLAARFVGDIGATTPGALDLFTALTTGIATQQVSNDPGGDRWMRLIDDAIDMFLDAYATHPIS